MAQETLVKTSEAEAAGGVVVAEEKSDKKVPAPAPPAEAEEETKKATEEAATSEAKAKEKEAAAAVLGDEAAIQQSVSFKEESNLVADLQEPEKKALEELKQLIQAALANNEFKPPPPPPPPPAKSEESKAEEPKTDEPAATEATPPVAEAKDEKVEEPASEVPKLEKSVAATEVPKAEEPAGSAVPEAPKIEEPTAPTALVEEKAVVVDEDGAKTVEAIEETVVSVTPPAATSAPAVEEVKSAAVEEKEKEVVAEGTSAEAEQQPPQQTEQQPSQPAEEVFIWGVPLLGDDKSDTVLLKFLRARDFKVKDSLSMIKNSVIWRKQFGIESLLEEDLAVPELEKVVFYHGHDKEGHPVCYNVYGEFQDQELYAKAFGDDEKREKFLRWRILFLEKGIRQQLDFSPGGISTMVQVTDLKHVPGPGKKELRQATKKALSLLQDNYPEFAAKQVFINVPWWYLAYNRMISTFFTQRTKSKFVFAGPSKSAETLFRYISPEQVPVQYGGLSKDNDPEFTTTDAVTEVTIKPSGKHIIELPATEPSLVVWELRVLGWDVSYNAEFVPSAEGAYTVLVQKLRKFVATDEPYVTTSFKVGEPGKIILTIDNATARKKKLLYRSKAKTSTDSA
ncbi:Patellin-3 [Apostasia shenzhenica]|uniref:Patellin-3 n=1 Tax=Apostasia shenzhenica TaxID=1088818 RepID=A0A2I0AS39_9ASPA|nr:Patellin-3 [Apostasia shenzhenica]